MDLEKFISQRRYLYHLTDRRNLPFIVDNQKLFSTVRLYQLSGGTEYNILRERRPEHITFNVGNQPIYIRDQRPLNRALDKCLTEGWNRDDFIYLLNSRVFMWPNIPRLETHFNRYKSENPAILRFKTEEVIALNPHVTFCRLNSGATRPSAYLGGVAPTRGDGTFVSAQDFSYTPRNVVEVTFEDECILPNNFDTSNNPTGPWISYK